MQKKAIPFHFDYPVILDRAGDRLHVCTLYVTAVCYRYPDMSLLLDDDEKPLIDFDGIEYDGKNLALFLDTVAEETYLKIREVARDVAKERCEIDAEDFGNLMSDHSEQPSISNL